MGISRQAWGIAAALIAAAAAIGLTYRFRPAPPVPVSESRTQRLVVQVSAEPVSLDPAWVEDGAGIRILANLMDGLVGYDGEGRLQPRLAEKYTFSEDRRTLTFYLRPGIKWSDGVPVEGSHFVAGLKRAMSSESKLGAVFRSIHDLRAVGNEIRVELKHPTPFILEAFTLPQALPIRTELLSAQGGRWPLLGPTTGDYRLREVTHKQTWLLEANPYALTPPLIREVELQLVSEDSTAVRLFETGRVDILTRVASLDLAKFESRGVLKSYPYFGVYFLAWNVRKEPGNSVDLRRAFARAVKKDELISMINGQASKSLHEAVANSFLPPEIEGHSELSVEPPRTQPQKSKLRQIQLGFDSSSRNTLIAEKIQRDAVHVGIDVRLDARDWKSYVARLRDDPPDLYRFGWLTPFRDPTLNLQVWTSNDPNNYTGWSDPEYDRLVEKIARTEPGPQRQEMILRAEKILISEQAVVVPLYYLRQTYAVSERVKGFRANPFSVIRYGELSF